MHGILNDEMGVYTEDKQGNPQINFQYIDTLYDALLKLHIRPFVELTFMPSKLASGTSTIFWWKGNTSPPKDSAKWATLIRALIEHWKQRYGEDEMLAKLAANGFTGSQAPTNIGHNPSRMTFVARHALRPPG